MQSQISNIMNDLFKNVSEAMRYQVQAMSQRADLSHHRGVGSGPRRWSFITMLMLEDTIANVLMPYGVCLGEATVTVYKRVSLANATAPGTSRQMMEFS